MPRNSLSPTEVRRIALAAQGFDRPRPGRVDTRHIRRALRQLGLLQIDYVNVLGPAQYHVLFSRLGPYDKSRLDDLVYRRREFTEQWAHEASIVPMETWPLLRHRRETHRVRPWGFEKFMAKHPDYVKQVLRDVRTRGPLTSDDLSAPDGVARRTAGGAWSRTVPWATLEAHFGCGRLAVADRLANFQRVYDLVDRIVPAEVRTCRIGRADAERALLEEAARSHGVGTAADLADYYRMPVRDARPRLMELVEAGTLHQVHVEGWDEVAYLHTKARIPNRLDAVALLSPFDPLIWYRRRAARIFDFAYTVEIFVPKPKRKWGYYVLPFLRGERLVARVDLKADRAARRLLVLAAYLEPGASPRPVAGALATELRTLQQWLGLDAVVVRRKGNLATGLAAVVRR
ncbi:MAG: winged helix DNA-binding domain-containing protein [Gemmatimonadetes bacterium]|nr:winged helix DNA-binding domain-containing protein [Gemmatimonadota bacterium]